MKKIWLVIIVLGMILITGLLITSRMASKEVLDAFGTLNEKIDEANEATTRRNDSFMKTLTRSDFTQSHEKAKVLDSICTSLHDYVEALKTDMRSGLDDPNDFETMDQSTYLDQLFFDRDEISEKGREFVDRIDQFRSTFIETFGEEHPEVAARVASDFTTDALDRNGNKVNWLRYHYEGFPLIASLTKLTAIQADIKVARQAILEAMLSSEK